MVTISTGRPRWREGGTEEEENKGEEKKEDMDNQGEEGIRATLRDHRVENGFKHRAKTYFRLII